LILHCTVGGSDGPTGWPPRARAREGGCSRGRLHPR
jgi:hypothetical protein